MPLYGNTSSNRASLAGRSVGPSPIGAMMAGMGSDVPPIWSTGMDSSMMPSMPPPPLPEGQPPPPPMMPPAAAPPMPAMPTMAAPAMPAAKATPTPIPGGPAFGASLREGIFSQLYNTGQSVGGAAGAALMKRAQPGMPQTQAQPGMPQMPTPGMPQMSQRGQQPAMPQMGGMNPKQMQTQRAMPQMKMPPMQQMRSPQMRMPQTRMPTPPIPTRSGGASKGFNTAKPYAKPRGVPKSTAPANFGRRK